MRIIQFSDTDILFMYSTLTWAIEGLSRLDSSLDITTHSYNQLRDKSFYTYPDKCVVFLEAGQLQSKHGGLSVEQFKICFPQSKIVVWCSDTDYYRTNGLQDQFDVSKVDLIFDTMPDNINYWQSKGAKAICIPWTISRKLYDYASNRVGDINLAGKNNDFISLINIKGEYRESMKSYLKDFSFIGGGDHGDRDLDRVIDNFKRSWISIGTSSHVRPELTKLGGQKGFRDALAIACNCLSINDRHPNVQKVWPIYDRYTSYEYGNFNEIRAIRLVYKMMSFIGDSLYVGRLTEQQAWLKNNLMDDLIYNKLKEFVL